MNQPEPSPLLLLGQNLENLTKRVRDSPWHTFSKEILETTNPGDCQVVCCGPEPMMEAVAEVASAHSTPCDVSLETPMACGIGICFSCVVKTIQDDGSWDYKRTCVEGPVFDAKRIVW